MSSQFKEPVKRKLPTHHPTTSIALHHFATSSLTNCIIKKGCAGTDTTFSKHFTGLMNVFQVELISRYRTLRFYHFHVCTYFNVPLVQPGLNIAGW